MRTAKGLIAGFDIGHWNVPSPIQATVGPLLGLAYIVVLPFVGLVSFIFLGAYRAKQSVATMWRRATKVTADTPERAGVGAIGSSEFLQPLIDGLECEFVVVGREFRIIQYHTPLLRQNKLLEQTAIGQYCFEVSHGRNKPCELQEQECPVRSIFATNHKVTVTHYHKNSLAGKGRQRLVKVLALPVTDSQGRVRQVAELIWDADTVNQTGIGVAKL